MRVAANIISSGLTTFALDTLTLLGLALGTLTHSRVLRSRRKPFGHLLRVLLDGVGVFDLTFTGVNERKEAGEGVG